jgi:hypothetical protein
MVQRLSGKFEGTLIDLKTNFNNKMIKKSFLALIFLYSWAFGVQAEQNDDGWHEPACLLKKLLLKTL